MSSGLVRHLSTQEVQQYHASDLSSEERLRLCDHVAECAECRAQVRAANPRRFDAAGFQSDLLRAMANDASAPQGSEPPNVPISTRTAGAEADAEQEVTHDNVSSRREWRRMPRILVPMFGAAALLLMAFFVGRYSSQQRSSLIDKTLQTEQVKNVAPAPQTQKTPVSKRPQIASSPNQNTDVNAANLAKQQKEIARQQREIAQQQEQLQSAKTYQKQELAAQRARLQREKKRLQDQEGRIAAQKKSLRSLHTDTSDAERSSLLKKVVMAMATLDSAANLTSRSSQEDGLKPVTLISPSRVCVLDSRPLFVWKPVEGATGYRIQVFSVEDNVVDGNVISHETLVEKEWQGNVTEYRLEFDLKPWKMYKWQVSALGGEQSKPLAHSKTLFAVVAEGRKK